MGRKCGDGSSGRLGGHREAAGTAEENELCVDRPHELHGYGCYRGERLPCEMSHWGRS